MKQQIFEELEAISEVEENSNLKRNECFAANSSKVESELKDESIDVKAQQATPDPKSHQFTG